jgi:Site-specific recombinase XerD
MAISYDARIWKTEKYAGKKVTTYTVRWQVSGQRWKAPFRVEAQADSFRSELLAAARRGEAFDTDTGRPVSMGRRPREMSWYDFACKFVDMKWPRVAATTRRTHAEALTTVTTAMFTTARGKPDDKLIRSTLCRWAFNTKRREDPECPADILKALRWIQSHTRPVVALSDPEVLRRVLDSLTVNLDGSRTASSVTNRKRRILTAAVGYAVELGLLDTNPIPALKWTPPRTVHEVDKRRVVNPVQARTLLEAVRTQRRSGPRLVAYFGCLYFAALRPEEAVSLAKKNLSLPVEGWGELHLEQAEPYAGKDWTDSARNRDRRQLKHREHGETRTVPCPPELTALLHEHLAEFGTAPDGRCSSGSGTNPSCRS